MKTDNLGMDNKDNRQFQDIKQWILDGLSDLKVNEAHDPFKSLLSQKIDTLINKTKLLFGNVYETENIEEIIYLLELLFNSIDYQNINIALDFHTIINENSQYRLFNNSLLSFCRKSADDGKKIHIILIIDEWLHTLSDRKSLKIIKDLLIDNIQLSISISNNGVTFDNGLIIFDSLKKSSCICRFPSCNDETANQMFCVSYQKKDIDDFSNVFKSLILMDTIYNASVL